MLNKFQEIELLLKRADEHLEWLRQRVIHPDADLIPKKLGFYIAEESFDLYVGRIRIVLGEYTSCLRNALNYPTCALAEQESKSGVVSNSVQFPIEGCVKSFKANRNRFLKGIPDKHVAFFERHQPYNARNRFEILRDYSNAYRHRELGQVQKVFQRPKEFTTPSQTERVGSFEVEVRFDLALAVAFPDGSRIIETLEELPAHVLQTVEEFKPLLAGYLSRSI